MSSRRSRITAAGLLLAAAAVLASCAGVGSYNYQGYGRRPDPGLWWFAFPEQMQLVGRDLNPGATADTLVFFPALPRRNFELWPDPEHPDPDPGAYRIRYRLLTPRHRELGEQLVWCDGPDRPRVAFPVPADQESVELRATLERVAPGGEVAHGRILRGSFRRTRR